MMTTEAPQSSGTSCGPSHRCMMQACHDGRSAGTSGPTATAGCEHRQRPGLAILVGQQSDQRAVWAERGHRPGASPRNLQPRPVRERSRLIGGQVPARECGRGSLSQVDYLELVCQLLQRRGLADLIRPYSGPPQRGQMPADAKGCAEIACERPDIRAARAGDTHVHVGHVVVIVVSQLIYLERADCHSPCRELGCFACASELV